MIKCNGQLEKILLDDSDLKKEVIQDFTIILVTEIEKLIEKKGKEKILAFLRDE